MSTHKFFVIIALFLSCLILCSCTGKGENEDFPETAKKNTKYDIYMQVIEDRVICQQSVTVYNKALYGGECVKLHLYPNAFRKDADNKGYYKQLQSYGGIDVGSVFIDGSPVQCTFERDGEILSLTLPTSADEEVLIQLSYVLTVPSGKNRLGSDGEIRLSNFYPVLCLYENGTYRDEVYSAQGDQVCLDLADFHIAVTADDKYTIVLPGAVTETEKGELRSAETQLANARDVAVVLSSDYSVAETNSDGIAIKYYYYKDKNADAVVETARSALAVFGVAFGKYPYATYTMAQTHLSEGGMEYSAMVLLGDTSVNTVVHETAHQWWFGLVGTDSAKEAYIDEGLATFCEGYYHLLRGDVAAFEDRMKSAKIDVRAFYRSTGGKNLCLNRPTSEFSRYEYVALCYDRSAQMFLALYELSGKECFNSALRSLVSNEFTRVGTEELKRAFDGCGISVGPIMDSFVAGKTAVF